MANTRDSLNIICQKTQLNQHHFKMAGPSGKSGKNPRLPLLEIEEDVFLNSILTSNGADVIVKKIYEFIKDDPHISDQLKKLYKDGLYSRDPKAKHRLRSRMYFIRRINR